MKGLEGIWGGVDEDTYRAAGQVRNREDQANYGGEECEEVTASRGVKHCRGRGQQRRVLTRPQ